MKKITILTFLILLSISGCSQKSSMLKKYPIPKLKIVKVKHTVKLKYKKAKHNYIVPIHLMDKFLKESFYTAKALNYMNKQAEIINNLVHKLNQMEMDK